MSDRAHCPPPQVFGGLHGKNDWAVITGSESSVPGAAEKKDDGHDDAVYGVVTGEKCLEGRAVAGNLWKAFFVAWLLLSRKSVFRILLTARPGVMNNFVQRWAQAHCGRLATAVRTHLQELIRPIGPVVSHVA